MTLIPRAFGLELQRNARASRKLKLDNLLKLRDFIFENLEVIKSTGWMKFYEEAGDWLDVSGATVRDDLAMIRNYPDAKLKEWITVLSFNHIDEANSVQNDPACKFDAAQLLDAAIAFGNGEGKRMTVNEMITFALGERETHSPGFSFISTLTGWIEKVPQKFGWDDAKKAEFKADIKAIMEKYFL